MASTTVVSCDLCKNVINHRGFPQILIKDVQFVDHANRIRRLELTIDSIEATEACVDICESCGLTAIRRHFKL